MKIIAITTFMLFIFSCGVKVDVPETKQKVDFGPNFTEAASFCDERYGVGSQESEQCFLDYRSYLNIDVGLNLDKIVNYCESTYTDPVDIQVCQQQLTTLLGGV